jgi:peptide/nickel transport system substrate-binding protein
MRTWTRAPAAEALALGACCVLLLLGCRRPAPPAPERTLTLAVRADITGIFPNPPLINEIYSLHVNGNIFEGLVRFDRNHNLEPALAERWESPDLHTTVFTVRRDARFSDGQRVTARDVAASLQAALERGWATRDYLQAVASVQALDRRRVEVVTRFPYPILLTKLTFGYVLPAQALATTPVATTGTGPYRLERWIPGQEVALVANRHYRGPPPPYARVRYVVMPGFRDRLASVTRGEAQLADAVPLEEIAALGRRGDLRVVSRTGVRVLFLVLRRDRAPFTDPRVREALDLAIDRQELIARALAGRAEVATQIVPRAIVGFNPGIAPPRFDPARARRLLAEAGFPRGLDLRLDGPANRYVNDRMVLDEVARQLARVGVRVEVSARDKLQHFPLILSGRSDFHLTGWACESGDAGDALDHLAHSPVEGRLGGGNSLGLADPELDRLIEESDRSQGRLERVQRLQAALQRLAELRPVLPLVVLTETAVLSPRIEWDPGPHFTLRLEEIRPVP